MGDPEAKRPEGKLKVKMIADAEPTVSRSEAERKIREVGVLGVFAANKHLISNLSSTAEFTNGLDESTILGGMSGDEYNARYGPGGGWGSNVRFSSSPYARDMGTARVGFLPGPGGPRGDDYSPFGGPGGKTRDRQPRTPDVSIPKVAGCSVAGCDKDLIRRYIKKQRARFRYCYEKALIRRPELAGTVRTSFMISGTGKVQGASSKGIGDDDLQACVTNVLSAIKFPVVADGQMVAVKYPFHFHSAGK
jgi:hypothetical protein